MISRGTHNDSYEPTPHDIQRACDDIQRRWSPELRHKRAVGGSGAWLPPIVRSSELGPAVQSSNVVDR